jgi:tetratricopeptide (TPR) repeat protein
MVAADILYSNQEHTMRSFLPIITALCLLLSGQTALADDYATCDTLADVEAILGACGRIATAEESSENARGFAYAKRCYIYGSLDLWQKAIDECNKSKEHITRAEVYSNLGYAKYKSGKLNEALLDAEKAIELDPNFETPYYLRQKIHEAQKCKGDKIK